jgi:hypothetical protein
MIVVSLLRKSEEQQCKPDVHPMTGCASAHAKMKKGGQAKG